METQKISQDVVSSLNINKIETVSAFQKYINVYAQSQISTLNNTTYQQETFELSSDSLSFLLNDFTLYLQMTMTTGVNLNSHQVFYKNSTGFIKGITIRTGSGQVIYHVEDSIQIIGNSHRLRNQISHHQESDEYKTCKFPGNIIIPVQSYINTNKQDANLDLLTSFAVGDVGVDLARDFTLSVSMKKILPWKQYLKLSDSSIYITITYNKPNEFLLLKNGVGATVAWNQSTFTNVKTMLRCNQQMDSQINQTLKQLYENTMYGFDYYTLKQATIAGDLTNFNYSCQITKNDGQMIKGLIIAVIKDNIESVVAGFCDYHADSQLTKVQSLQLYFDSQQVENNPFTQKPCGNQLISQQQHVDLWYYDLIQSHENDGQTIGGYQFGSAQSYNLNLQLGLRTTAGIQSKLVIFVVGQKFLKQSQNQVMVL